MIREIIRKIVLKEKSSSNSYINYLKEKGVQIGEDVTIYVPSKTVIDIQYPWMISIGNHVRIAQGVIILTHDYSWSVLKRYSSNNMSEGKILGASGYVIIGNNVFIGMNSIITRNVNIGNNVIIGAGSIVTKDCEEGYVYAGNPARKVMSIEEYYKKRENKQLEEAKKLAQMYFDRYNRYPPKSIFYEYFMLFETEKSIKDEKFIEQMKLCGNFDKTEKMLKNNKPIFSSFEEFIKVCFKNINDDIK